MKSRFRKRTLLTALSLVIGIPLLAGLRPTIAHAQQTEWDYNYTGYAQSFTAPYTGTYKLEAWGAEGGSGEGGGYTTGGKGGYSEGEVNLVAGQKLYVYVGGQGQNGAWNYLSDQYFSGGWNGGGGGNSAGGAGGGATDIRTASDGNWQDYLSNRIIVAGGGAGGQSYWVTRNSSFVGAPGGGLSGGNGSGAGGTQSSAGSYEFSGGFGYGGPSSSSQIGGCYGDWCHISGGGGGYYGGAGYHDGSGGGGGSGYIGGVSNAQTIAGNQSMSAPLGGTEIGQPGDGYAKIVMEYTPPTLSLSEDNTAWNHHGVTITATATSDKNSISWIKTPDGNYVYSSSAQYTVYQNGTYTFTTQDSKGGQTSQHITVSNIDTKAPSIWLSANTKNWTNQSVTVSASASDGQSGIRRILIPSGSTHGLNESYYSVSMLSWVSPETSPGMLQSTSVSPEVNYNWDGINKAFIINWTGFVQVPQSGYVTFQTITDDGGRLWVNNSQLIDQWHEEGATAYDATIYLQAGVWYPIRMEYFENYGGGASAQLSWKYGSMSSFQVIPSNNLLAGSWVNGSTASMQVSQNGTYNFLAEDNAGNVSANSITVNNIDTEAPNAPTISTNVSTDGWTTQKVNVTLSNNGDNGTSGVNRIEYRLSGSNTQNWTTYGGSFTISNDGVTTVYARVIDNAGNVSTTVSKQISIDTTPPSLQVSENPTDLTNADVTLTANASDLGSGMQAIELPDGNWVNGTSAKYEVNQNGNYTFVAKDNVGHTTSSTFNVNNIKKNVLITNTPQVVLKLHAEDTLSGVKSMQFRNEYGSWSSWQPYSTQVDWTLSNGDGLKHVWARYMDNAGNVSNPVEDIIILDTTPPTVSAFSINGGAQYTNNPNVTLKLSASDALTGVKDIYLSNDGTNWTEMPYATSIPWTLSNGDGNKTVYLKVSDVAGNISSPTTSSIFLDTTKPNVSVKINGGAQYTATRDVTLTINYSDPSPGSGVAEVKVFEGSKEYDIPQPLPNSPITIPWTLDYGTVRTVSVEAIDRAGNVSDVSSATIIVDKLTMQDFVLENVVNPLAFTEAKPFTPLTWSFAPQPMLAGANFTFAIDIKPSSDPSAVTDSVTYEVDVVGDSGYHKVFTGTMTKAVNHYTQTITLPADAPKGAKVYVSAVATRKLLVAPYDTQTVYFPGTDASSQAEIGTIQGNIYNSILFNETT